MTLELDQLQAATNDYWKNKTTDIFFTENIMFWRLMGNGGMEMNLVKGSDLVDGGKMIREFLEVGKSNGGSYGNKTKIDASKRDIINAALFGWSGEYASNGIDLDEQVQNTGKAAMVDLVMAKMGNIEKTIRENLGKKIYQARGSDPHAIIGLGDLFNTDTSVPYGNIAEDDMAQWKANVITTAEAMSFKVMQAIWRMASVGQTKAKKPNLAVTTEVLKDSYERTIQIQQRFSDKKLVEAGFDNILHKGAPVVSDDNQAEGTLDAVNLEFLKIKTHSKYNFTTPIWEKDRLEPDSLVANTRFIGQLTCSNRAAHCRHTGLTEAA